MYLLGKAVNLPFQRSIAPKRGSLHQRTAFPSSPGWLMALDGALTQCLNRLMFIQLKTESYAAHLKRNILFTLESGQIWRMVYTQRWTDRLSFWGLRARASVCLSGAGQVNCLSIAPCFNYIRQWSRQSFRQRNPMQQSESSEEEETAVVFGEIKSVIRLSVEWWLTVQTVTKQSIIIRAKEKEKRECWLM